MSGSIRSWLKTKLPIIGVIILLIGAPPTWANGLTVSQQAAVRSAKQYLRYSPFSKQKLISQITSKASKDYKKSTAQKAVSRLDVNWKKQAVRAAKQHIKYGSYTCKSLILQLNSSAGAAFTMAQAKYGAKQTSLCQPNNKNGSN